MAEKTKAFEKRVDQGGRFFLGYSAVLESHRTTVALVCPTIADLRRAWKRLSPNSALLDESSVQRVRIHEDK